MCTVHRRNGWIAAAAVLSAIAYPLTGSAAEDGRFEKLSVYLERNVQDRDAEMRFGAAGTEDGLATLKVMGPGERTVIDVTTPGSKLRKLTVESPEPTDEGVVRADFPAGAYRFEGKTNNGASLHGEAWLSHVFPRPAAFEYPRPGQKDVSATAVTPRWSVPEGIESCAIVIEQTGSPYEIRAQLPGSAKSVYDTRRARTRWPSLQIRNRDRGEGRQPVLHRSRLRHREGAMNQPHPSNVRSARDEPTMSRLMFRNGDTPAPFLSFISQMRLETLGGIWPDPPPAIEDIEMLDKQMKPANWPSGPLARLRAALATATILTAAGFALAGGAVAGEINEEPRWKHGRDYSSLKDWHLKGENIVPHGVNPLYYPIMPGHKHVHERPDHPDGKYRKETVVLDATEDFDLPGIGKFKTAVVQEEEYLDGVLTQRALNWFALDKTTNSVYVFGEVSWEINEEGKPIFAGTWRAGELDGDGVAEPGLLMPGTFTIGGRYIFDGSQSMAYGGAENMEAGIEITVPAGTFRGCVRVREQGLLNLKDITDKIWCPVVGVVLDTSDGKLVASNVLPKDNPASDVSSVGKLRDKPLKYSPPVAKISGEQATKIALELIPGKATSLTIERKRGKNVYVVEIQTPQGEKDVFVDIESGKIVGTD